MIHHLNLGNPLSWHTLSSDKMVEALEGNFHKANDATYMEAHFNAFLS